MKTKPVTAVLLALLLSVALIGCQSSEPVESIPQIVTPAAPVEAPAPAPVVEEAAPAAEETAPVVTPITGTLSYAGYSVSYEAVPGEAVVTYPADVIYDSDIDYFFAYALANHPELLSQVVYQIPQSGTLVLNFPEEVTVADAEAVVNLLAVDLEAVLANL